MITTSLLSTSLLALAGGLGGDGGPSTASLDALQRFEVRANTYTNSTQEDATLAADADGRLLVAWTSRRQEGGTYGVFAQLLDPLGRAIGTELHVNESLPGNQSDPNLAFGADGGAWAAWNSIHPGNNENGIFVRRLADGPDGFGPVGPELRVGVHADAFFHEPVVAAAADGGAFVAWLRTDGAASNVLEGRSVSADGTLGEVIRLETEAALVRTPDLVALADGAFFAAWGRFDGAEARGIAGLRIVADGSTHAVELVPADAGVQPVEPSLDVDADGALLVAWAALRADGSAEVRGQRFDATGAALGTAVAVVAPAEGHFSAPTAIAGPDGRFALAFNHHTMLEREDQPTLKRTEVVAQAFDASGAQEGELVALASDYTAARALQSGRNARRAAWTAEGQLAVAWSGSTPGDGSGIGVSVLVPEGFDVPAPPAVRPMPALAGLTPDMVDDTVKPDIIPPDQRGGPTTPATFGLDAGTGFRAHTQTQFTPPDPDLSVSANRIVTQVNGRIRIFDKAGSQLFDQNTNGAAGFWGAQGGENFIFDPVNTYNTHSNRHFVMNSELATGDWFVFAASTVADPSNGTQWNKYRVQVSPTCNFPDFPNLGFNQDAYFITTDCFSGGGNRAYIIDRTLVESGASITSLPSVQMSGSLQSLGNTKRYDAGSTQYFISAGFGSGSNLKIQAITNPTTAPSLSTVNLGVPSYSSPPDAAQQGTTSRLDTIDARIKHGVVRDDILWATHNVGVGGVARVRWYEIDLNGWPTSGSNPSVTRQGDINVGSGVYTWFGEIAANANGDVVIAYNRSASNEFPSVEYVVRPAGDLDFDLANPCPLQVSAVNYIGSRYGDYSGLVIDPSNDEQFYSHHQYSEGNWSTWTGDILIDGGTNQNPTAEFSATPLAGDAPLLVSFTDLSTSLGTGISSWAWSFGDGASSTAQNPTHTYVNPGTYTVSLTVTDNLGSDSEIKTDYITATVNMDATVTKRNGSGVNPDVFNTVTLPVIGTNWVSTIDSGAAGGGNLTFVFGYSAPAQAPTVFGELLIDPTSTFFLTSTGFAIGGVSTHTSAVPNDNALIGLAVFTQGFINNPGILTNALDLTLGL